MNGIFMIIIMMELTMPTAMEQDTIKITVTIIGFFMCSRLIIPKFTKDGGKLQLRASVEKPGRINHQATGRINFPGQEIFL